MFAASPCHVFRQAKWFATVAEKLFAASALWFRLEQNLSGLYAENVKEHTTDVKFEKNLDSDNNF